MTVDYWNSSQFEIWQDKDFKVLLDQKPGAPTDVVSDSLTYLINSIDSLADQLPKFVRNSHAHYTAIILAHRYVQTLAVGQSVPLVIDGQICCEIAALSLFVAVESDGKSIPSTQWDSAIIKVFPCEVVHRGIHSAVESGEGPFVEKLGFDLFVYHPFETLSLLLADVAADHKELLSSVTMVGNVALSLVNSLYRTIAVLDNPPYVVAVAALVGALLLAGKPDVAESTLNSVPVDIAAVEEILVGHLYSHLKHREIPLPSPPAVEDLPSPSARTGRSVSRHSSRSNATSTKSGPNSVSANKRRRLAVDPNSLAWALLPRENDDHLPQNRTSATYRRPVTLSELRVLKEISRLAAPEAIVKLIDVRLYSAGEEATYRQGGPFVVNGLFDCSGTQFDSVVRLLTTHTDLLNVIEQLLSAVHFLGELKICHFGIEPKNLMISSASIKIASLSSCSVLPTITTTLPSFPYRAPELLFGSTGGVKDDALAVDLWSLGCVIAELARIFSTRNRYEEPLFRLTDSMPDKPPMDGKCPVLENSVYTSCRYVVRLAGCLNKGQLPAHDVWPGLFKRGNYENVLRLMEYQKKRFPDRSNSFTSENSDDLKSYLREGNVEDGVVTEIVKALLRWSPDRRVSPRVCLGRIMKFKLT